MKKGQAAMEFLMSYGWAILVVIVVIGALAYFGVLNPSRFLPASCTIAPGMGCDDFKICATGTNSGSAKVLIRNGMGTDAGTPTITLGGTSGTVAYETGHTAWDDGTQITVTWADASGGLTTGSANNRFKEDIVVTYTPTGGLQHSKTGTITTKIEAAGGCT